ncbi:hypothetical protein MTO96_049154 [Rhipicephalus appendiculatus]
MRACAVAICGRMASRLAGGRTATSWRVYAVVHGKVGAHVRRARRQRCHAEKRAAAAARNVLGRFNEDCSRTRLATRLSAAADAHTCDPQCRLATKCTLHLYGPSSMHLASSSEWSPHLHLLGFFSRLVCRSLL